MKFGLNSVWWLSEWVSVARCIPQRRKTYIIYSSTLEFPAQFEFCERRRRRRKRRSYIIRKSQAAMTSSRTEEELERVAKETKAGTEDAKAVAETVYIYSRQEYIAEWKKYNTFLVLLIPRRSVSNESSAWKSDSKAGGTAAGAVAVTEEFWLNAATNKVVVVAVAVVSNC